MSTALAKKTYTLNTGAQIPAIGLGKGSNSVTTFPHPELPFQSLVLWEPTEKAS